jgi:hypothetical protein
VARRRRRNRGRQGGNQNGSAEQPTAFWGSASALPDASRDVNVPSDPALAVRSLGPPPLPGREVIAEHYFEAVYGRVAGVAGALAVAAGMLDPDDLADEVDDPT